MIIYSAYKRRSFIEEICYCADGNKVNTIKNFFKKYGAGLYSVSMFLANDDEIKKAKEEPGDIVEIGDPGDGLFIKRKFLLSQDRRELYFIDSIGIVYMLEELCPIDGVKA